MINVSTNNFRDNLSEYLDRVMKEETSLIISRFGKPLVEVSPYKRAKVDDYRRFFGFMGSDTNGEAYVNKIRRNKRERERIKRLRNG